MEEQVNIIINSLKKERRVMYKMIEADEKKDQLQFNYLKNRYRELLTNTNKNMELLLRTNKYEDIYEYLYNDLDIFSEVSYDKLTFYNLLTIRQINDNSKVIFNENSDVMLNKMQMQLYDLYLWNYNNSENDKELEIETRYAVLNELVCGRAMRHYFSGEYYNAEDAITSSYDYHTQDLMKCFYSMLNDKIIACNKLEMFDGMINKNQLESQKEIFKLWFATISIEMKQNDIIFPLVETEMSDFTENIVRDASILVNNYLDKDKKVEKIIKL